MKIFSFLTLLLASIYTQSHAAPCSAIATGNWSSPGTTWSCGSVPVAGDAITIPFGNKVTVDNSATYLFTATSLTVNGTLEFMNSRSISLPSLSTVTLGSAGTIQGGNALSSLTIGLTPIYNGALSVVMTGPSSCTTSGCSNGSLPVAIQSFTAHYTALRDGVQIEWETSWEKNSYSFAVERSADAIHFEAIAWITARNEPNVYTTEDIQPLAGKNYYRLRQTDKNGAFIYSKVITARATGSQLLNTSPNPVAIGETLSVSLPAEPHQVTIKLYNNWGKEVLRSTNVTCSEARVLVAIPQLPKGVYLLQVEGMDEIMTQKISVAGN